MVKRVRGIASRSAVSNINGIAKPRAQMMTLNGTGWQVLPADAPDFEEAALHACELVIARDPRIGKLPKSRRAAKSQTRAR